MYKRYKNANFPKKKPPSPKKKSYCQATIAIQKWYECQFQKPPPPKRCFNPKTPLKNIQKWYECQLKTKNNKNVEIPQGKCPPPLPQGQKIGGGLRNLSFGEQTGRLFERELLKCAERFLVNIIYLKMSTLKPNGCVFV